MKTTLLERFKSYFTWYIPCCRRNILDFSCVVECSFDSVMNFDEVMLSHFTRITKVSRTFLLSMAFKVCSIEESLLCGLFVLNTERDSRFEISIFKLHSFLIQCVVRSSLDTMGCLHQGEIKCRSLTWYTARSLCPPFAKVGPYLGRRIAWKSVESTPKLCQTKILRNKRWMGFPET